MSLLTFIFSAIEKFLCDIIVVPIMVKLRLGNGAKVWVLVSHLHPKDVISNAYPNYTMADKAEGLVVASEGSKPIHHEEKMVVCFIIPPNTNRHKKSIVGCYIALFMSQKNATNQDCSLSPTVQVRLILRKHKGHNKTPTTQSAWKIQNRK